MQGTQWPYGEARYAALHDAAYRYAYRRSRSHRLAHDVALEALDISAAATQPADRMGSDDDRTDLLDVLTAARKVLQRFLPPDLPPRLERLPHLQSALAALPHDRRETLLLGLWDGLEADAAARVVGIGARPPREEGLGRVTFATALVAADPALDLSDDDLARSRAGVDATGHDGSSCGAPSRSGRNALPEEQAGREDLLGPDTTTSVGGTGGVGEGSRLPRKAGSRPATTAAPSRRIQTLIGAVGLIAVLLALVVALVPPRTPTAAEESALLLERADVVAVVDILDTESILLDNEVRVLQTAALVQLLKGDAGGADRDDVLTLDVTGRDSTGRPFSRNLFPPYQLVLLDRTDDGLLVPLEGDLAVLSLVDLRNPEARTVTGVVVPLPDDVRRSIDALPEDGLAVLASNRPPGDLDQEETFGIRPPEGRDVQNLPGNRLGAFSLRLEGDTVCTRFDVNGRSVHIRWPQGFSAYARDQTVSYADGDPEVDRTVLTILNERGYPYTDQNRSTPFIRGVPTGQLSTCAGQERELWDIVVGPGTTLLNY